MLQTTQPGMLYVLLLITLIFIDIREDFQSQPEQLNRVWVFFNYIF